MKKIFFTYLVLIFIFTSCFYKEDSNQILTGVVSFENKDGKNIVLSDHRKATGIIQGKEDLFDMDYDMKFKEGIPTGEITFFNNNDKMIDMHLDLDFKNSIARGNIEIFFKDEHDGKDYIYHEYRNIEADIENFLDTELMKPTLKWYIGNTIDIFRHVEEYRLGKKISEIRDKKQIFYDDEENPVYLEDVRENKKNDDIDFEDVTFDNLEYVQPVNANDIYEKTDHSVKKLRISELYLTGLHNVVDDYGNEFEIEYKSGIPTGNMMVIPKEKENLKIEWTGKYNFEEDVWNGDISVKDSKNNNKVNIKNAVIKGKDLFVKNNEIIFAWMNYNFDRNDPIDKNHSGYFVSGEIFYNNVLVGKIDEGIYIQIVE